MLSALVTQLVFATALLHLFPSDAGVIEHRVRESQPGDPFASEVVQALELFARPAVSAPLVSVPEKIDASSVGVITSAVSAIVVDRASGAVLYEKNAEASRSIGSITKLMTAYVFLESEPDLDAPASLTAADIRLGGVQHLAVNDEVRVRDLLWASLIGSDNSATAALVRLSKLSEGDFVAHMNETAAQIGMRSTTFRDPTGLSPDNRSVAPDVVRLLNHALAEDEIREATEQPFTHIRGASGRVYVVESTDELLGTFLNENPYDIVGGKTGFLPEAGYCLGTIVSEDGGHELSIVVLGSETITGRFQDVKALAVWAYNVYRWPDEQTESFNL